MDASKLRSNVSRQSNVECGYFVSHYIEDQLRIAAGHGGGRQGWPNPVRLLSIRQYMSAVSQSLHSEHGKWCQDKAAADVQTQLSEKECEAIAKQWLKAHGLW